MTLARQALVGADCLSDGEVAPFLNEIARMRRNLDRVLPDVRAFVRPGFDELDEVARIERLTVTSVGDWASG